MTVRLLLILTIPLLAVTAGEEEERKKAERKMMADLHDARVLYNDKKFAEAEKAFAKFTEDYAKKEHAALIDPKTVDAAMLEAQVSMMDAMARQKKLTALKTYGTSKMSAKPSVRNHLLQAKTKLWERDRDGSMTELEQALTLDGESYLAWYMKGELHYGKREEAEAITSLKKSLEHNEAFVEALYLLGQIYMRKGDKQNTRKYWNEFLKHEPRKGTRFEYVNNTLLKMGGG